MADESTPDVLDLSLDEDRYARLRLIPWWDQKRLAAARALVVGAGALGNEICKNLALLGIGRVMIVDMDTIEDTNLTRSVLFRHSDRGQPKAQVIARAMQDLNPDVRVQPIVGNVIHDLGAGVFREMDIVFGALDNREARVYVNATCWRMGRPWIDGAIEIIQGVARLFCPPDGPCYECTMSEADYRLLSMRRSCALLSREDVLQGKIPTTPTTASVIAGIQVQEAIKWLHRDRDLPTLAGKGFVFNGLTHDSYVVEYQRREDCPAHDELGELVELQTGIEDTTLAQLLQRVREEVSAQAVLEFDREICTALLCHACGARQEMFMALGKLTENDAPCPQCGELREPQMAHAVYGDEPYLDRTLAQIGLPPYDVVRGRAGMDMRHYLLARDRDRALGTVA